MTDATVYVQAMMHHYIKNIKFGRYLLTKLMYLKIMEKLKIN